MLFFKKKEKELPAPTFEDKRKWVIEWLRELDSKAYEKIIKVVETYREADEKVKIIEFGSKKAVREAEKEEVEDKELDEKALEKFLES